MLGAWRAGKVGWIWARLRTEVFRLQEYKYFESSGWAGCPVESLPTTVRRIRECPSMIDRPRQPAAASVAARTSRGVG